MELSKVVICPLFFFSLFTHGINDIGRDISEGIKGAMAGDGVNGVSYMLYADDLSLTTNDSVMHFNSRSCSSLPTFEYGDVALPQKEQFNYIGMLVDKHITLKVSEEHVVQPYMAAQQRTKKFVHKHILRNRPHAFLWLSKVCGCRQGCVRAKCGVQNIYEKDVSSKANCRKGICAP
eukprot:1139552-Pelagomonas_calceolata.AAC.2